jgi:hypothetical protein
VLAWDWVLGMPHEISLSADITARWVLAWKLCWVCTRFHDRRAEYQRTFTIRCRASLRPWHGFAVPFAPQRHLPAPPVVTPGSGVLGKIAPRALRPASPGSGFLREGLAQVAPGTPLRPGCSH